MSLLATTAYGIDVSDGTLKAVRLSRRGRRIKLHRTWRVAYHDADGDPEQAALDALESFVHGTAIGDRARVVISAPSRGAFSRTYLIPAMDAGRVAEFVRYEVLNELTVPEEDVLIRHHVRRAGAENEVHAYALRRRRLDAFRQGLQRRRVAYDDLETPGFALASFVELEMPRGHDRLLLAVGRLSSELVILTSNGLWMRHLPLGLRHGTHPESLAHSFKNEIASAIAHFLPGDRVFSPEDLVLTEEGALDARFTGALKKVMGMAVTRVGTLHRIQTPARLDWGEQRPELALSMGKAMGLALTGLGLGRFRCPAVSGNARRDTMRLLPAVATGVLAAAVGLLGLSELVVRRAATLDATLPDALATQMHAISADRAELLTDLEGLERTSAALAAVAARRPAAFMPKQALAAMSRLDQRDSKGDLFVDRLWLTPGEPGRAGVMKLTIHADRRRDETLAPRLELVFGNEFDEVAVHGPEPGPNENLSRFLVEVGVP